ncbi:hypothetical protein M0R45_038284 [Rubus argutus]|uniref:Uncharacterized protein n=1 Tax=Rubus argutus TaxID=59490 RepID=A0AAW1W574_RUBAR
MVPTKPLKPCHLKNHTTASALDKKGSDALFQPAKRFLPAIQERTTDSALEVHYCKVREEDYDILEEKVKSAVENYPEFHITRGSGDIEYLLGTRGFSNSGGGLLSF